MDLHCRCLCPPRIHHPHLSDAMTWNHRKRFAIVLFALVNLLFMQLAVAAYACPDGMPKGVEVSPTATMAHAGMPCAESLTLTMDDEQPSLCHAHCKAAQQTADKHQVLGLVALADLASDFPLPRVTVTVTSLGVPLQAPLLARTTVQSVAVRHCCFRL